ncbi:flavin monoamine oxidase family protein [Thalassotalea montiporae]
MIKATAESEITSVEHTKIAIVGGGLSGLYAAYLLEQHGITDYVLLEAREWLGGRIESLTVQSAPGNEQFDLGPTWYWSDYQPQLAALISELGLASFAQYEQGKTLVEHTHNQTPNAVNGYINVPTSMRLKGGMSSLIQALSSSLTSANLRLGTCVKSVSARKESAEGEAVKVTYFDAQAASDKTLFAERVLLALPPRLATATIDFSPALPNALQQQWQSTSTWMAAHAKYVAVFEQPFWRKQGLSGSAQSRVGPMLEIHDASADLLSDGMSAKGKAAVFGFIGVPANVRQSINQDELITHCRRQLVRLFGDEAATPIADAIKDWSQDNFTATAKDLSATHQHPRAPKNAASDGAWREKLVGIGSEWSTQFPGYLAGAIEAAYEGVEQSLQMIQRQ